MASIQEFETFRVFGAQSVNNLFGDASLNPPQNPGLAANNWNSGHQDSWCSESVSLPGPTSEVVAMIRKYNPYGYVPIMGATANNMMVGMSFKNFKYNLIVFDEDCEIISATQTGTASNRTFAGGYFYLDNEDNAVAVGDGTIKCLPTANIEKTDDVQELTPKWESANINNLVSQSLNQDETQNSLYGSLPLWGDKDGDDLYCWCLMGGHYDLKAEQLVTDASIALVKIDTSNPDPGSNTTLVDVYRCVNQWNNNTFSVDEAGACFVTNGVKDNNLESYIYKVGVNSTKTKISLTWKGNYDNCGVLKMGQTNIGSGTTPSIFDNGNLVAITDNAKSQLNVTVYDTTQVPVDPENNPILPVSKTPVFSKMRSACEASLIAVGKHILVENNFGHTLRMFQSQMVANEPGMAMIKLADQADSDGTYQSEVVWEDDYSYLAMSMLARESGVIYAITGDWSGPESANEGAMYYMTAKDSYDGRVIWRLPMGRGNSFCHNYGGIYFNRHGDRIYVGTLDYLVCVRNLNEHATGPIGTAKEKKKHHHKKHNK